MALRYNGGFDIQIQTQLTKTGRVYAAMMGSVNHEVTN